MFLPLFRFIKFKTKPIYQNKFNQPLRVFTIIT